MLVYCAVLKSVNVKRSTRLSFIDRVNSQKQWLKLSGQI